MKQAGSRTCAHCGATNAASDQFCSNCGYSLTSGPPDHTIQSSPVPPISTATRRRITGALQAGDLLSGRYRIAHMIGRGGFGAVYKASDGRFQFRRVVAIKEMSDALLSAQEKATAIQNFRNEAELLVELNHPNLPNVSDFFEEGGKAYLVMEFVEGKTLEAIQDEVGGPLNEQLVMGWALQLCAVLHYLHTRPQPIIFRDMKPANVMVTAGGEIKLIDFGIARIFKAAGTKDTTLLGSQGYAPLEQYGRGQSDARSDIYALGATLYNLLTKELPADSPSRRINPQLFVLPRQLNPAISPATEAIVLKAMTDEPKDRYQSAADMYQAMAATGVAPAGSTLPTTGNTLTQISAAQQQWSGYPITPPTLATAISAPPAGPGAQSVAPPVQPPTRQPPATPPSKQPAISRRAALIGGAAMVGTALAGGTALFLSRTRSPLTGAGGTITLKFTYSTEKEAWMQQAIGDFNNSNTIVGNKTVQVTGDTQASLDAQNGILNGSFQPIIWSPASFLEINQLNLAWQQKHGQDLTFPNSDFYPKSLASSPLVFAIWRDRADILTKKYKSIDWSSIHDAVKQASWADIGGQSDWGPVKLAQTRPDQSNSGLLSITLIAYAYYHVTRGLTTGQVQNAGFLQYFKDIEDAVQEFGRSSGTYLTTEVIPKGPSSYDIAFTYENLVLTNEHEALQRNSQTLQPFYPGVNIVSDHPFAVLNASWVSTEDRQAALAFRDFLLSDDQQRKALLNGFRPVSQNVTINDGVAGNPFKSQPGDVHIPQNISNIARAPDGDVSDALLNQWNNLYSTAPTALSNSSNPYKGQPDDGRFL